MGCIFGLFSLILVSYFQLYFSDLDFLFLLYHHKLSKILYGMKQVIKKQAIKKSFYICYMFN